MRRCADPGRRAPLAAALGAAALLACTVASPATEVKEALARLGPVEVDAGGTRVALGRVSFSDVVVSMDGPHALVLAVVQADGTVRLAGAEPSIAYVGREAFRMERCAGPRWCLAPDALAALRSIRKASRPTYAIEGSAPASRTVPSAWTTARTSACGPSIETTIGERHAPERDARTARVHLDGPEARERLLHLGRGTRDRAREQRRGPERGRERRAPAGVSAASQAASRPPRAGEPAGARR